MTRIRNIITLSGRMGSGKSTLANDIQERLNGRYVDDCQVIHLADNIRLLAQLVNPYFKDADLTLNQMLTIYPGWDYIKNKFSFVRSYLQILGTSIRQIDPEFWVKAVVKKIERCDSKYILIPDVRFVNEIAYFTDNVNYNVLSFYLEGGTENSHVSEKLTFEDIKSQPKLQLCEKVPFMERHRRAFNVVSKILETT